MPPKAAQSGWKMGEQLEFLLSHWPAFKCAQDAKTLGVRDRGPARLGFAYTRSSGNILQHESRGHTQ